MNHSDAGRVSQLDAETRAVEAAIREATHEAVLAHKRLGLPMATWQDGQVIWIPADQLAVEETNGANHRNDA
jgi:hypothetical protein